MRVTISVLVVGCLVSQTTSNALDGKPPDDVSPFTPTIKDEKGLAMLHKGAKHMMKELDEDKDGTISLR